MRLILAVLLTFSTIGLAQDPPAATPATTVITKAALEERLAGLQKSREQTLANLNAYNGAIEECQYWLDQLRAEEKAKEEAKKKAPPKPANAPEKPEAKKPPAGPAAP
jgi:hypothetical protein